MKVFFSVLLLCTCPVPHLKAQSPQAFDSLLRLGALHRALEYAEVQLQKNDSVTVWLHRKAHLQLRMQRVDAARHSLLLMQQQGAQTENDFEAKLAYAEELFARQSPYQLYETDVPLLLQPALCPYGNHLLVAGIEHDSTEFPMTGAFAYELPKIFFFNPESSKVTKLMGQKDFWGYLPGSYDTLTATLYYTRVRPIPGKAWKSALYKARLTSDLRLVQHKKLRTRLPLSMHPFKAGIAGKDYLFFSAAGQLYRAHIHRHRLSRLSVVAGGVAGTTPVFDNEQNALFFSSPTLSPAGGYDVYKILWADTSAVPVRMGAPIADAYDNLCFHPPGPGRAGLLIKKTDGTYHLYRVENQVYPSTSVNRQNNCHNIVYYPTAAYEIPEEYLPEIEEMLRCYTQTPEAKLLIEGHTDSVGSEPANERLAYLRAYTVSRYIQARGIPLNRLSIKSYGFSLPAHHTATPENAKNRRVEIRLIKP